MNGRPLADDGAGAASTHQGPDEKGDAGARHEVSLHCEEMADLMNREPDGGQRTKPEDEEGCIVGCRGARIFREGIWDGVTVLSWTLACSKGSG